MDNVEMDTTGAELAPAENEVDQRLAGEGHAY
jgi:hypothetical protein